MANEEERIRIQFDTNAQSAANDANKLAGSLDKVEQSGQDANKSMKDLDATFEQVYGDLQPLTTRMGEAEDRLYELALAGQTATQEYQDLLQKVAEYRKTQIETDRVVDAAATTLGQKLAGASQLAATGVQGVTAGMALFGDQSEETEKALLKVQAAMAFADAIGNISTLGGQWRVLKDTILASSLATKANTAATGAAAIVQNLFTGSVNTTSVGFKTLKLAIAGTGIGLLVVGVAALVTNFDKVKKVVFNLVPGLAQVGEFIGGIINRVSDFVGITSEAERAVEKMKASADASLKLNKKYLAEHESQLDEFTKQKIAAKNQYLEAIKEEGADRKALALELNRQLAKIEYSRGDESRKIAKENAEKAQKEAEDRAKKAKEEAEKKAKEEAEALKKDREEDAAALLDFQRKIVEAEQENKVEARNQEEQNLKDFNDKVKSEEEKRANEQIETEKKIAEAKQTIKDKQDQNIVSSFNLAKTLAGKNKTLQKALLIGESLYGIAKDVISTRAANAAVRLKYALLPGGVALAAAETTANNISSGLGIAANVAATAKALQSLGGGSGGSSSGSTGGATIAASAPPSVAFNNTAENQIAQATTRANADNPPLQVTVLESDITKAQNNVNTLVKKNTF